MTLLINTGSATGTGTWGSRHFPHSNLAAGDNIRAARTNRGNQLVAWPGTWPRTDQPRVHIPDPGSPREDATRSPDVST